MKLTPREREIIALACDGTSNADISKQLGCSVATVKKHMSNIFDKVGCYNRTELAHMMRDLICPNN